MLKIEQLNQFYGASHTLWDLELEIVKGKCTCLMGRNGVGKTTLVQSIMGILPIQSGQILFEGNDISKLPIEKRVALGIAYVPQGRQIFPLLTVEENLKIGLTARRDRIRTIPDFIYEIFPILKEMSGRRGGDLSGGQQQQLAIGRALVLEPDIVILDEPTEGIQPNIVQEIGDIINHLNKAMGLTALLVEQKLPITKKVADHFVIMDRGRTVATGNIAELNDDLVSKYLTV